MIIKSCMSDIHITSNLYLWVENPKQVSFCFVLFFSGRAWGLASVGSWRWSTPALRSPEDTGLAASLIPVTNSWQSNLRGFSRCTVSGLSVHRGRNQSCLGLLHHWWKCVVRVPHLGWGSRELGLAPEVTKTFRSATRNHSASTALWNSKQDAAQEENLTALASGSQPKTLFLFSVQFWLNRLLLVKRPCVRFLLPWLRMLVEQTLSWTGWTWCSWASALRHLWITLQQSPPKRSRGPSLKYLSLHKDKISASWEEYK